MNDPTGFEPGAPKKVLVAADIQQKEFRVSRFGGYKMRDVDEFLDEITDSFSALTAEVDRLRTRPGAPPVVGTPDLDDVARQADEIIGRAREEAARIVADARGRSPAPVGGEAAATQGRAAVGAFLAEEREFLQSLAGLVQGHAETVKGMVKAARAVPTPPAPEADPDEAIVPEAHEAAAREEDGGGSEDRKPPEGEASAREQPPATVRMPGAGQPAHVEEPTPATMGRGDDEPRADPPEGSLRDLFWGEE
jgi:DivIVA domain-containing protein